MKSDSGQVIAEYAILLRLVLAVGTLRLAGNNANMAFSQGASTISGQ